MAWLCLILLPLALYAPFMNNPLVFDDHFIQNGASEQGGIDRFPDSLSRRWIFLLSLWVNASLQEQQIFGYRLVNLAIHLATCGLVLVITRRWLAISDPDNRLVKGREIIAYAGTLLFAIHPAAVYAVGYLAQRSILLSTLFALVTVGLHAKAQAERKPLVFLLAALAFALSVLSKEHSVALPGFLVVLSYWLHRNGYSWSWRWSPAFLLYGGICLWIIRLVPLAPASMYEANAADLAGSIEHPYLVSLLTQALFFFRYLGLWLLPLPAWMGIDLHSDVPYRILPWLGAAGAALLAAYAFVACRLVRRTGPWSVVGLCAAYSLVMFISEFWTIRLSETFVIYRSYLWFVFVGPMALLSAALLRAKYTPRIANLACLAVITLVGLAFAAVTVERLGSMSTNLKLWQDAVNKNQGVTSPTVARTYMNLGVEFAKRGQIETAQGYFQKAIDLNPKLSAAYHNLGNTYAQLRDMSTALAYYDLAISADPDSPGPRFVRADLLLRMNRSADAMAEYQGMLQRSPDDPKVLNNIAAVKVLYNEIPDAMRILERLIATGKAHDVCYFNLALAHVRLGEVAKAKEILARAIDSHPNTPLLLAFELYLSRGTISRTRWLPRIDPRTRAP